ncbi:hypothetical protein GCM10009738_41500 [Kitasatospora viridis]|uniref:Uncharacterized protein n=1 Tax=Kitasatospora viridis TaxID=281105 RepID=A0A561TW51_9ACTN|nr:hypothetical protein FHX73_12458 [Kitasatospora viridis]
MIAAVTVGLCLGLVLFVRAWSGKPYPVADPTATAHRLDGRTQAVYDAMALPPVHLETPWGHNDISTDNSACGMRGIRAWINKSDGGWRPEPNTYAIVEDWKVADVTRPTAQAALQRAQQALTTHGWTVVSYDPDSAHLVLHPPAPAGDTVDVAFDSLDHIEVTATSECVTAVLPAFPDMWTLPSPSAPSQLRN